MSVRRLLPEDVVLDTFPGEYAHRNKVPELLGIMTLELAAANLIKAFLNEVEQQVGLWNLFCHSGSRVYPGPPMIVLLNIVGFSNFLQCRHERA